MCAVGRVLALGAVLLMASPDSLAQPAPTPAGDAQSAEESDRWVEGELIIEADSGELLIYTYTLVPDSLVSIELVEGGAGAISFKPVILRALVSHYDDLVRADSISRSELEVGVDSEGLRLVLDQSFSLAGLLLLVVVGLLGMGVLALSLLLRRERKRRLQLLQSRLLQERSQEAERRRIAREVHDGPVQDLHALALELSLQAEGPEHAMGAQVNETIRELRAISEGLLPPALAPFGIAPALEGLFERLREREGGLDIELEVEQEWPALQQEARLSLFRITQEAVSNALQHGRPTAVRVRMQQERGMLRLVIEDDGDGFDPSALDFEAQAGRLMASSEDGGFGLLGIHERATLLGGTVDWERLHPGMRVTFSIPERVVVAPRGSTAARPRATAPAASSR